MSQENNSSELFNMYKALDHFYVTTERNAFSERTFATVNEYLNYLEAVLSSEIMEIKSHVVKMALHSFLMKWRFKAQLKLIDLEKSEFLAFYNESKTILEQIVFESLSEERIESFNTDEYTDIDL